MQLNSPVSKIKPGYGDLESVVSKAQHLPCDVNEGGSRRFDSTQSVQERSALPGLKAQSFQLLDTEEG